MNFTKIFFLFCIFFLFLAKSSFAFSGKTVIFSEIAWMGTTNSSYDEWIELKNISLTGVDLNGWKVEAEDGSPVIDLAGEIPANSFFLLERTDDDSALGKTADLIYSGGLGNSDEVLYLKNGSGEIVDEVTSWFAGDNSTKEIMLRDDDLNWINGIVDGDPQNSGDSFEISTGTGGDLGDGNESGTGETVDSGTGSEIGSQTGEILNSTGTVYIYQVLTDPQNDWSSFDFNGEIGDGAITDLDEFVQLFNPNDFEIDLTDRTLEFLDSSEETQVLNGTISSSGYLVIGNPDGSLNNSIKINLKNSLGELVDSMDLTGDISGNASDSSDEAVFKNYENGKIEKGEVILEKQILDGKKHIFQKTDEEIIAETEFSLSLSSSEYFYRGDDIFLNLQGIEDGFSYQFFESDDDLTDSIQVKNSDIYKIQELNGKIYFANGDIGIFKSNMDGSDLEQVYKGKNRGFLIFKSKIYYISYSRKIYELDLNGEGKIKVTDISAKDFSLETDGENIFFIGKEDGKLYKIKNGLNIETDFIFTGNYLDNSGTGFFINEEEGDSIYRNSGTGERLTFSNLITKSKQLKIGNHSVFAKAFLGDNFASQSNFINTEVRSKSSGGGGSGYSRISSDDSEEEKLTKTQQNLNLLLREKRRVTKNKLRIKSVALNEKEGDYLEISCIDCNEKVNISGFMIYNSKIFYHFPQKSYINPEETIKILLKKDISQCEKLEFCAEKSGFTKTKGSIFLLSRGNIVFDGMCWSNGSELKGKAKYEMDKLYEVGAWKGECIDTNGLKYSDVFTRIDFQGFNKKESWEKINYSKKEEKVGTGKTLEIQKEIKEKDEEKKKTYSKAEIEVILGKKISDLTDEELTFLKEYSAKKTYFHKLKLPKERSRIFRIKGRSLANFRINLQIDGKNNSFWTLSDQKGYFSFEIPKLPQGNHGFFINVYKGREFLTKSEERAFELTSDWQSSKYKKSQIVKKVKKTRKKKSKSKKGKKGIVVDNGLKIEKKIETKVIKEEKKEVIGIILQKDNHKILVNGKWYPIKSDDLLSEFKYKIGDRVKIMENGTIVVLNSVLVPQNFNLKPEKEEIIQTEIQNNTKIIEKEKDGFLDKTADFLKDTFDF